MSKDARIDAVIAKAQPFAQPILAHLRELVHKACPKCEETIKWGMPSFVYEGKILCGIAAFKQHAIFALWHNDQLEDPHGILSAARTAMGSLGRITSMEDLPSDKIIIAFIKQAMKLIENGVKRTPKHPPKPKGKLELPDYFTKALKKNTAAKQCFDAFSPSQQREYIEWLTEAKSDATREKRLDTAIEWIAEGKIRNWKYVRK